MEVPGPGSTVFIVDDDEPIRDSLALMLGLLGYRAATFTSAEAFLDAHHDSWRGCVVADLKMHGKSGLELQAALLERGSKLPFVIITAHGGVSSARAAFKAGAVDFLEKPFEEADLCAAIEKGMARESERMQRAAAIRDVSMKLAKLTDREREVLFLAGQGLHAKEIARSLGITPRTVEVHKASVMGKIGVRNVSELVRFALSVENLPGDPVEC